MSHAFCLLFNYVLTSSVCLIHEVNLLMSCASKHVKVPKGSSAKLMAIFCWTSCLHMFGG